MSKDIAESLLAQYYGISEDPTGEKFPSIQECVGSVENDSDKLIGEQSTVETNDDDTSRETGVQENEIENEEENFDVDTPARSSRALEWEALGDDEETSYEFDITFDANTTGNLYENTRASSGKETRDLSSKTASSTLGLEDNEGNDSYLSLSEDVLPDSASDISSTAGKKKTKRSTITFVPPSTPPSNRTPIYNETFVDLTSTGLTSLPIETIEQYPAIRMLYLEDNNLPELPDRLFISLQHLQWLDVRNNLLTSLPASIKRHPSLETILLQGNKIETLPLELCLVPKLKTLSVAYNPITAPAKDIIAQGCSSILNYLRSEWNKSHPNEPVTFVEQKIEPKASTILCYRSPREKRWKLSKVPRRISKSTNDIGGSFKGSTIARKRAYKPSNRYGNTRIGAFPENLVNNISDTAPNNSAAGSLCVSCARNFAATRHKDESRKKENDEMSHKDEKGDRQHAFLKMIASCHGVERTCIKGEIAEVDAKILHLTGPSPRSCYVRQNLTELITYKHYREKECRIRAISNETKHIALAKSCYSAAFGEENMRCKNVAHPELVFDIVTKDMRRMQLRPMQLKDSRSILSCLENYLDVAKINYGKSSRKFRRKICEDKGTNVIMEQRLQWISKARDLLSAQSATVQRIKDIDTVKEWRRDKRSFNKSMEKISRRNEDDIPFAINIEDYPAIRKRSQNAGDCADNKQKNLRSININQKIQELTGFLQKLEITKSSEILTPKSKQKYLQTEIEKLSHFQKEIHNLRRYNEIISAPMNSPNNSS